MKFLVEQKVESKNESLAETSIEKVAEVPVQDNQIENTNENVEDSPRKVNNLNEISLKFP